MKCRVCQNEHSGSCASFFSRPSRVNSQEVDAGKVREDTAPRAKRALASAAPVSQLASSTYRHRDAEKRREYQRDLMRSRRRAARRDGGAAA